MFSTSLEAVVLCLSIDFRGLLSMYESTDDCHAHIAWAQSYKNLTIVQSFT